MVQGVALFVCLAQMVVCGERGYVRLIGLEPTRPKPPDPKSGASTNFATSAYTGAKIMLFSVAQGAAALLFAAPSSAFLRGAFLQVAVTCVNESVQCGCLHLLTSRMAVKSTTHRVDGNNANMTR